MTIFNKEIKKWYIDIAAYIGLLVSGVFFLGYVGNSVIKGLLEEKLNNTGAVASYLIVASVIVIFSCCTCEDKRRSYLFLISAGLIFFVILINKNVLSIWLMIGIFLAIPILFRPTAELIKRDMQLLFLFAFILCNMSLLTNYTTMLQIETVYDLEISVYLEMILAIGGLVFFHYWDRLPEGADLRKVSMLKLQRKIKAAIVLYGLVFLGLCLGGNHWKELSDQGVRTFIKGIAVPLVDEMIKGDSLFFLCVEKGGIIVTGIVMYFLYKVLRRMRRKHHPDKPVTNMLFLLTVVFIIEFFSWHLTIGNILLYSAILFLAFHMYEEKKKVTIIQGSIKNETEIMDQSYYDDIDSIFAAPADDADSVCKQH